MSTIRQLFSKSFQFTSAVQASAHVHTHATAVQCTYLANGWPFPDTADLHMVTIRHKIFKDDKFYRACKFS